MSKQPTYSSIPDPRDFTPNQPAVILQPVDVSAICNFAEIYPTGASEEVKFIANTNHVIDLARTAGWGEITLIGKQILLVAKLSLDDPGVPAKADE